MPCINVLLLFVRLPVCEALLGNSVILTIEQPHPQIRAPAQAWNQPPRKQFVYIKPPHETLIWTTLCLQLHSGWAVKQMRRTVQALGKCLNYQRWPKTINPNHWTLCPNMICLEQRVPACVPLSYSQWFYLITPKLPRFLFIYCTNYIGI